MNHQEGEDLTIDTTTTGTTDTAPDSVGASVSALEEQAARVAEASEAATGTDPHQPMIFDVDDLTVFYGSFRAVKNVSMEIRQNQITALIGPSGCGKSTVLRCFNRMNDLIETARVEGTVHYHGVDLYGEKVDPVEVRRRIGMVFQKPNPFPKSIYENIVYGPKIAGWKGNYDELVEEALIKAALWDEVKDKLKESGMALSGWPATATLHRPGHRHQPRRGSDGRAVFRPRPDRNLEDRGADARVEEGLHHRHRHPQHAASRSGVGSDRLLLGERRAMKGQRTGYLVEYNPTEQIFTSPTEKQTEDYITGRFG